jgi:hypothetical protein
MRLLYALVMPYRKNEDPDLWLEEVPPGSERRVIEVMAAVLDQSPAVALMYELASLLSPVDSMLHDLLVEPA